MGYGEPARLFFNCPDVLDAPDIPPGSRLVLLDCGPNELGNGRERQAAVQKAGDRDFIGRIQHNRQRGISREGPERQSQARQ